VFAGKMREQKYLTMLDPFQEVYGSLTVFLVYVATLWGDLFWTASILTALGINMMCIYVCSGHELSVSLEVKFNNSVILVKDFHSTQMYIFKTISINK